MKRYGSRLGILFSAFCVSAQENQRLNLMRSACR